MRVPVPSRGTLSGLLAGLGALALCACSPHRDVWKDRVLAQGTHDLGSAIDSDYFVQSGAILHLDYAAGCRIYIEKGGTLRGLAHGTSNCSIAYEQGAHFPQKQGIHYFNTKNAELSFTNRHQEASSRSSVGISASHAGSDTDDVSSWDDDDEDCEPSPPTRSYDEVRISSTSYQKKDR